MDARDDAWTTAVEDACRDISPGSARARRRHGRQFAEWCGANGHDPCAATSDELQSYLKKLQVGNARDKARCDLRAVLRAVDPVRATRVSGLGNVSAALKAAMEGPAGGLLRTTILQADDLGRQAVRASALARLVAWASEVDVALLDITAGDLIQFWQWLVEVDAALGETKVVARDFIELRHSPEGRAMLGEPEPTPPKLLIEVSGPLRPLFELDELPPEDPCSDVPRGITFTPIVSLDSLATG